jgi:signal peptidase I
MTQPATPQQQSPSNPVPPASNRRQQSQGSVKETLESILVAFILAFVFRAFVVEAFVIPTGSMAPTLLGAHMRFRCKDCGYQFDVNYSPELVNGGEDLYIPSRARRASRRIYCPNCGCPVPAQDPLDPDNASEQPEVHYGDRILVLKYLYLFQEPQRWDVVVFKSPDKDPGERPPTYTQNYIKRLIGRPGESVLILDGDIYIGKGNQDIAQYQIQTKPRYAQQALWRIIYNNDYYPQNIPRVDGTIWKQPWTVKQPGDGGWKLGDSPVNGRIFHFDNSKGASTIFFDPDANRNTHAFTDWLGYDYEAYERGSLMAGNVVHDLKLSFVYDRSSGTGPLSAKLSDGDDKFIAELTPSDAKLIHVSPSGREVIGSAKMPSDHRPVRVELTNVDYRAALRINDVDIAQTTPKQFHPDVPALLDAYKNHEQHAMPAVEISASNQTASLSHIGLWRDVYYINRTSPGGNPLLWAVPNDLPRSIMHLGPDEYFVLGDNSLISGDARYWDVPIDLPAEKLQVQPGRVPGRFLLGRAFFVYWPAGYRPTSSLPGLAPDFGDMRFIR